MEKIPSGLAIGNGEDAYAWNVLRQKKPHYGHFLAGLRREFGLAGALLFPVVTPERYGLVFIPESESESEAGDSEAGIWDFTGKKLKNFPSNGIDAGEILGGLRRTAVSFANTGASVPFQVQGVYFLASPLFLPGLASGVSGWLYMLEDVSARRVLSFWGLASLFAAAFCLLFICKALLLKQLSTVDGVTAGAGASGQEVTGQENEDTSGNSGKLPPPV
ncbi:hypothetical protein LJC46_08160 [Desulfovibrio sp. OttesenSCG-928-G15]|nr:hypothetical protein [Desulfovibrio sp. OttesenSCG-928-G15]